jgi:uncharacterized membrane protein
MNNTENVNLKKEHFSVPGLDFLDPTKMLKDILISFLFYLLKSCVFGYIIYLTFKHTGLLYEYSIKNYIIFFIIGSIVLYLVSFLYFMYRCYNNGVNTSDMNYEAYAISSILGPVFILSYIIFITIVTFIKVTPLVGTILYMFTTVSFLIVLSTGIAFNSSFELAYSLTKCAKE